MTTQENKIAAGRPGPGLPEFLSALPDLGMAALAFITWISPTYFGQEAVSYVVLVILVEFIVVHSAPFMGQVALQPGKFTKIGGVFGLGLLYTLFVGGMSLAFHKWWPVFFFWGHTLNRLLRGLTAPPGALSEKTVSAEWGASIGFYLLSVFAGVLLPLPKLGLQCSGANCYGLTGSGLWIDQPQTALFSCALYFSLQAAFKLYARFPEPQNPQA